MPQTVEVRGMRTPNKLRLGCHHIAGVCRSGPKAKKMGDTSMREVKVAGGGGVEV